MKKVFGLLAMLVLVAAGAFGQTQAGLGALAGTVMDSSKAVVPGARVVLTNPAIGYRQELKTGNSGSYSFSPLTVIGGYSLEITAPGFTTQSIKDITTSVGTVITQNVSLAVGKADTVVEVQGTSEEQVQTDTSAVSQIIDKTVWQDSPLEDRNQNNFVGLTAGAAPSYAGRGYAINGARSGTGNFTVDGVDNNDQGLGGGAAGGAVTTISPDAIQEFRVISSTPPAEYGRAGGFATDTVLKSGTTKLHGSAFEYNRSQGIITANNWFSDYNGLRDHLVRNQFGGSLGGPVYKDRTFFFASAEFQRLRQGSPEAGIVTITPEFLNFVKSGAFETFMEGTTQQNAATNQVGACPANNGVNCPGQLSRSKTLGAVFSQLYAAEPSAFPLATQPITGGNVAQGLFTAQNLNNAIIFPVQVYGQTAVTSTSAFDENRGTMKIDHKLTDKDQLSFTYLADLYKTSNNHGSGSTPGLANNNVGGAQLFGATYTRTFSPTLINVFKASYLRHVNNNAPVNAAGVPNIFSADALYVGFGAGAGDLQLFTENQFGYEDSLTKTLGRHTVKGGFGFKRTRNGSSFYNDVNGTIGLWSAEGLLTDGQIDSDLDAIVNQATNSSPGYGGLYTASASLDPTAKAAPDPYRGYRANEFAAYLQDDFKVSSRLTFNYGLRWEYFGPPHNFKSGVDSNVYFGSATTVTPNGNPFLPQGKLVAGLQGASFQLAQANGRSTIWNRDTNNFAPRFGFALDTMGNQKFVIRGGFGVGYDRLYNNVYENIRFNAPFFVDNTAGLGYGQAAVSENARAALYKVPFTGNSVLPATGAAVPRHVDQNLVTAYYEQAHLGFETNVLKGYVLEVNYIGTFGRKLVGLDNINTFAGRTACPTSKTAYAIGSACYNASSSTGGFGFTTARPSSAFASDNFRTNGYNSNYNGGQVSLRRGFQNGLQIVANYTYSKGLDELSDVFSIKGGATGSTDPYNRAYDYGPSDNDVKHLFVLTGNYISHSSTHKLLLGGWGISPIITLRSGTTFTVVDGSSSYSPEKTGLFGNQRAVYTGTGSVRNAIKHGTSPAIGGYLNPQFFSGASYSSGGTTIKNKSYACPTTVAFCDAPVGRNFLTGPRLENLDIAVSKHLYFGERLGVTFQAAAFDAFNHPEFGNPVASTNSGTFGLSTGATSRVGQISGRIDF